MRVCNRACIFLWPALTSNAMMMNAVDLCIYGLLSSGAPVLAEPFKCSGFSKQFAVKKYLPLRWPCILQ